MWQEFKKFAMKGNIIDLAVAVVIGAAFKSIVSSFVDDIIMPPLGLLLGGVDFSDLMFVLKEAQGETPAVTLNYGTFIQSVTDFIIIAFAIFMAIKAMNNLKRKEEAAPEPDPEPEKPSEEVALLTEIRDSLRNR